MADAVLSFVPASDEGWRARAKCLGVPVESFFTVGRPTNEQRRLCDGCPVKKECLADVRRYEYGKYDRDCFGFRAGMTAGERGRLWREQAESARLSVDM